MKTKTKRNFMELPPDENMTFTKWLQQHESLEMTMGGVTDERLSSLDFIKVNGVKFWNPLKK